MSNPVSLHYWNDKIQRGEARRLQLVYSINGAKDASDLQGIGALVSFDAITQAQIDAYLGTSSEFDADAFDATAMGTDMFGGVLNCSGQVKELLYCRATVYSPAAGTTQAEQLFQDSASLTASTLQSEAAVSSAGNLGFKIESSGLDALTAGVIIVEFAYKAK
jgi:hypothetical protein